MGASLASSQSTPFIQIDPTQHCKLICQAQSFQIYQNDRGETYQKYLINKEQLQKKLTLNKSSFPKGYIQNRPSFEENYQYRLTHRAKYFVELLYAAQKDNGFSCNFGDRNGNYEVVTERITVRVSQMYNLSFSNAITILNTALKGFKNLYNYNGSLWIKDSMIGINQNNQVKVWLNSNFSLNTIEPLPISLLSLPPQNQQDLIVNNLIDMISSKTYPSPEWKQLMKLRMEMMMVSRVKQQSEKGQMSRTVKNGSNHYSQGEDNTKVTFDLALQMVDAVLVRFGLEEIRDNNRVHDLFNEGNSSKMVGEQAHEQTNHFMGSGENSKMGTTYPSNLNSIRSHTGLEHQLISKQLNRKQIYDSQVNKEKRVQKYPLQKAVYQHESQIRENDHLIMVNNHHNHQKEMRTFSNPFINSEVKSHQPNQHITAPFNSITAINKKAINPFEQMIIESKVAQKRLINNGHIINQQPSRGRFINAENTKIIGYNNNELRLIESNGQRYEIRQQVNQLNHKNGFSQIRNSIVDSNNNDNVRQVPVEVGGFKKNRSLLINQNNASFVNRSNSQIINQHHQQNIQVPLNTSTTNIPQPHLPTSPSVPNNNVLAQPPIYLRQNSFIQPISQRSNNTHIQRSSISPATKAVVRFGNNSGSADNKGIIGQDFRGSFLNGNNSVVRVVENNVGVNSLIQRRSAYVMNNVNTINHQNQQLFNNPIQQYQRIMIVQPQQQKYTQHQNVIHTSPQKNTQQIPPSQQRTTVIHHDDKLSSQTLQQVATNTLSPSRDETYGNYQDINLKRHSQSYICFDLSMRQTKYNERELMQDQVQQEKVLIDEKQQQQQQSIPVEVTKVQQSQQHPQTPRNYNQQQRHLSNSQPQDQQNPLLKLNLHPHPLSSPNMTVLSSYNQTDPNQQMVHIAINHCPSPESSFVGEENYYYREDGSDIPYDYSQDRYIDGGSILRQDDFQQDGRDRNYQQEQITNNNGQQYVPYQNTHVNNNTSQQQLTINGSNQQFMNKSNNSSQGLYKFQLKDTLGYFSQNSSQLNTHLNNDQQNNNNNKNIYMVDHLEIENQDTNKPHDKCGLVDSTSEVYKKITLKSHQINLQKQQSTNPSTQLTNPTILPNFTKQNSSSQVKQSICQSEPKTIINKLQKWDMKLDVSEVGNNLQINTKIQKLFKKNHWNKPDIIQEKNKGSQNYLKESPDKKNPNYYGSLGLNSNNKSQFNNEKRLYNYEQENTINNNKPNQKNESHSFVSKNTSSSPPFTLTNNLTYKQLRNLLKSSTTHESSSRDDCEY